MWNLYPQNIVDNLGTTQISVKVSNKRKWIFLKNFSISLSSRYDIKFMERIISIGCYDPLKYLYV